MAKNPMHNNLLACYPALLTKLATISGIKKIKEIQDIGDLSDDKPKTRLLDGTVYVLFDGFSPIAEVGNAQYQSLQLSFSLILVKRSYTPSHSLYTDDGLGETLTAIARALQGFEPREGGYYLTTTPFKQTNALPVRYLSGFALFPMRFVADVAI